MKYHLITITVIVAAIATFFGLHELVEAYPDALVAGAVLAMFFLLYFSVYTCITYGARQNGE